MVNEVSSGVVISSDKTIITYLLKEEDWQKDAAKQCKEDSSDYLPLVGQRVRRVGESYTHKGIEKYRSGEDVTIEVRMQPIEHNPLPPPARAIIYCGGGFQGWRKLGPSPIHLYNFATGETRPFKFEDFPNIKWGEETIASFEWFPIGSDDTNLYLGNKSDDSIWRYDTTNGWRLFCEKPEWASVQPEPWWHDKADTPEWRANSKWYTRDRLTVWKDGTLFCFRQLAGNVYRPMSYSEQEGWQQLGPDWRGGSGTYTNSASPTWAGSIAYPAYPVMLGDTIIYEIREYSGSSDNPKWDGTAMYSQGPDMPFGTDWRENQMTPKCSSGMHESMADQGTFVKDEYKNLYFIGHVGEQYTASWGKNTGGCNGWKNIGGIGFGKISRFVTVDNIILCIEDRSNWYDPPRPLFWTSQYDLNGKYDYPDYTRMDEFTYIQGHYFGLLNMT